MGRKPAEVVSFESVKDELVKELKAGYLAAQQEKTMTEWRETFRKEAEVIQPYYRKLPCEHWI